MVIEKITEEALSFSLYPTEYTYSPVSTVSDSGSNTVTAPWVYGSVTNFPNLVQTGSTTFHNPSGLTSGLTFKEDGTSETISQPIHIFIHSFNLWWGPTNPQFFHKSNTGGFF